MNKYYNRKIPTEINFIYGGKTIEVLKWLNKTTKENKESIKPFTACSVPFGILYKLHDYITNLQEENKELQEKYKEIKEILGTNNKYDYELLQEIEYIVDEVLRGE